MRYVISAALCAAATLPAFGASCESLSSLTLPDTKITLAQTVAAGAFTAPGGGRAGRGGGGNPYASVPEFCRVTATISPSSDSEIKMEIWLPASGWNQKLQVVGNGGWAGTIGLNNLAEGVKDGYATAGTDTGHAGNTGSFALGHPEKLIDFAYRSEHETTVKGKAITEAFYGSAPKLSYWNGCSTGGRQALKEAQKYPNDFDGIIAGAPANRNLTQFWDGVLMFKEPGAQIPASKLPMLHQAVVNACDAKDGLKDGQITDPRKCDYDPKELLCKGEDGPNCLTAKQVETARGIWSPVKDPKTGREFGPALPRGSELTWGFMGNGPDPYNVALDQLKYIVFQDPNWDWHTFDLARDGARYWQPQYLEMNATDPNLKPFFSHNGKLLMYQGYSDPNVSPFQTIAYFQQVVDNAGGAAKASDNVRLFFAPGMGHCGGGDGPNDFDKIHALESWVEKGQAPQSLIATQRKDGSVTRTRPLCPFPQVAKYKGTGSIDDAASFSCAAP
jgi:feruloyl esterase